MEENVRKLQSIIKQAKIIIHETLIYTKNLILESSNKELMWSAISYGKLCNHDLETRAINFNTMREFMDNHYYKLLNVIKDLFVKLMLISGGDHFTMEKWQEKDKLTLFFANYIILNQNFRSLKNIISQYFIKSYKQAYELIVDGSSPLWDINDMKLVEYPSEILQVRNFAKSIVINVKFINKDFPINILEEQVAEIIKNAVKHGNKNNKQKKVKVWYLINRELFKIIVEDEGDGFNNFDEWNSFNKKRNEAIKSGNMEEMIKYIQYKGPHSSHEDGGNALFAALEYWDSGLVYNKKKNKVVAVKYIY